MIIFNTLLHFYILRRFGSFSTIFFPKLLNVSLQWNKLARQLPLLRHGVQQSYGLRSGEWTDKSECWMLLCSIREIVEICRWGSALALSTQTTCLRSSWNESFRNSRQWTAFIVSLSPNISRYLWCLLQLLSLPTPHCHPTRFSPRWPHSFA